MRSYWLSNEEIEVSHSEYGPVQEAILKDCGCENAYQVWEMVFNSICKYGLLVRIKMAKTKIVVYHLPWFMLPNNRKTTNSGISHKFQKLIICSSDSPELVWELADVIKNPSTSHPYSSNMKVLIFMIGLVTL